ncbi:uncharacterized protein F4812DRAFT_187826 [Daldinia caldariorum]|uniref:uncharacterized protein n=1 Tax=Daldinia caldariorum TaxID=326644 RepID=UPI002008B433|nr:uncharacterized protein F4812DRAFT_187826 [Daldinia caldariorum]KAI1471651.1 hypothetical protein F4812DRAFT_187826 [Daldinia caldariorum]
MHFLSLVTALSLAGTSHSAPVISPPGTSLEPARPSSGPSNNSSPHALDGNQDDWPPHDPFTDDSYCHIQIAPGPNLTEDEKAPLMECYNTILRGAWLDQWYHCDNTYRYFKSFGASWNSPDDCYNACKRCFISALHANAANWYCFQIAGFLAQCNVRYMQ